jgi:hypothetical protein
LGDTKVSHGDQAKLSSMGISGGKSLLVYKWDDLPGPYARKLAKEDENMPAMQGVPNHATNVKTKDI